MTEDDDVMTIEEQPASVGDTEDPAAAQPPRHRRRDPRPPRVIVDFSVIAPHQAVMHARLENWATWSRGRYAPASAPGFERYQSPSVVDRYGRVMAQPKQQPLDVGDARRIGAAVTLLPEPHRKALGWFYVRGTSPKNGCMEVGATMEHLYRLIQDGRQMLINRGA
ncbi:MAG: hypothetical protein DI587_31370 [Variovorax paradoxus]|nr:MAG: hypothetical protein DI583_31370 [Variovorax paradoxus]PZQ03161.1 MAG: hypothetical protein DI587_31370 [Variovorax paradoxus]